MAWSIAACSADCWWIDGAKTTGTVAVIGGLLSRVQGAAAKRKACNLQNEKLLREYLNDGPIVLERFNELMRRLGTKLGCAQEAAHWSASEGMAGGGRRGYDSRDPAVRTSRET